MRFWSGLRVLLPTVESACVLAEAMEKSLAWARDPASAGSSGIVSIDGAAAIMLYTQACVA